MTTIDLYYEALRRLAAVRDSQAKATLKNELRELWHGLTSQEQDAMRKLAVTLKVEGDVA